jgi:hypothetical protein
MKVLSLIPPMTQLNTPYPSTAYLTGFLRSRGVDAVQEDLALALVLSFFTPDGLSEILLPKKTAVLASIFSWITLILINLLSHQLFHFYKGVIARSVTE